MANALVNTVELEVSVGRRAFPVTQEIFAGSPVGAPATVATGWYDSSVDPETGAFALVRTGAGLDALIGEIIEVSYAQRSVFVYVLADAALPTDFDLGLARRAFSALSRLTAVALQTQVVAVQ